ncbi:hypothetical protein F4821DRAFT_277525 [Hypoxylon rubiginosum]|uniref:Uncharacterized protein n=1 Tax=Hypoxylon rubiginosum TaxID=110542 RepID=A0ACC0D5R2_9PEZI|nr:hypothetical protein F4821DRAFT_277525 [Hypoxylon rubiginosum]
MSGTCDSGFVFYSCNNGFKGCCSVSACDSPDGCPDDAMQPEDTKPTPTTTSATKQPTPSETTIFVDSSTTPETVEPSSTFADSITTATPTPTLDGSVTSIEASTPSSPTDPASTSVPQSSNDAEAGPPLSTAAIAGICVGGTVFAMFILLIISLRIRRHRIAKRHASSADAGVHYSDAAFAEDFMKDHPSISAMRNSRADGGDLALFIPNSNS